MNYLKKFYTILKEFFPKKLVSKYSNDISPSEPLARFLYQRNHMNKKKTMIKPAAFMPNPKSTKLSISVFRIFKLPINQIWKIGTDVGKQSGRTLYGRGDVKAFVVTENKLQIKPDDNPPKHANILGWPTEKHEQKLIALELATKASAYEFIS